ncbi:nascent polypeptide-associated complex subunit alpha, muscle-specific form [Ixodes scapularis]|uniref:nascent polypeptide-associated complex subunit alpha, muscle-specific form n=1 Tax=Ixodes scapularis TaxID=6945 RepID=UPI001C38AD76|nr:nascent polypeptide-associated complex subunit alpha, muscle-specific form [Ixodes scapularis]
MDEKALARIKQEEQRRQGLRLQQVRAQAREEARRVRERVAARKEAALRTVANLPQKPGKPPLEAPKKLNEGSSSQLASRRALQPTTNRDGQGAASTMSKLPARIPSSAKVLGSPDDVENVPPAPSLPWTKAAGNDDRSQGTSCAAVTAANPLARALSEMTLKQRELFGETEQDLGRGVAASSPTPARAATPKRLPPGGLSSPRLPTPASAKTSAQGKARLREFYMRLLDDCGTQTSGTPLKEVQSKAAGSSGTFYGCSADHQPLAADVAVGADRLWSRPPPLPKMVAAVPLPSSPPAQGDAPRTYTGEPACVAKNESPDSFLVHTTSLANVTHRRRRRRQSWGSPLFLASSPTVADASSATVAASPVATFQTVALASSVAAGASPAAVDALRRVARVSPLSDDSEESPRWLPPPVRMRQSFGLNMEARLEELRLEREEVWRPLVCRPRAAPSEGSSSPASPFVPDTSQLENPSSCDAAAAGTPFRADIRGASPPWFAATRSIVQARGGTAPSPLASPGTTCIRSSPVEDSPASRDSEPSERWQGSPSSEGEDDGWVEEQWEKRPRPCPPPRLLANQEVLVPRMLSTIAEMETPDLSSSTGTSSSAESGRAAACVPVPRPGQASGGMEHLFSTVEHQLDKLQSGLRSLPKPACDSPRQQLQSEATFEETQLVNVEQPTLIGADFSLSSVAPERSPTKEAGPVRDPLMHQWLRDQWLRDQYSLLSFERHEESLAQADL